jgi:hypothetical protein
MVSTSCLSVFLFKIFHKKEEKKNSWRKISCLQFSNAAKLENANENPVVEPVSSCWLGLLAVQEVLGVGADGELLQGGEGLNGIVSRETCII